LLLVAAEAAITRAQAAAVAAAAGLDGKMIFQ
jgi:hypothetical protein